MRAVGVRAGGRRAWVLPLLTGCLILGTLGVGAVEAHAATPTSLAGETFTSQNVQGSTFISPGCVGTSRFSVSGTASGPFPGTFTESGSFSSPDGDYLTDFSSTFTITSTSGTVTGTKRLVPGVHTKITCTQLGDNNVDVSATGIPATYTATINGTSGDQGTATVNITGVAGEPPELPFFSETFGSGVVGGPPPNSSDQCKHGGWKSFGTMFKNQGDCVSFVATGGKNPPSGS